MNLNVVYNCRKDMNPAATKNKSKMSVRKDKDYRKLQQELTREKEKFDQHMSKLQRDLQDCQQQLLDEQSTRQRLAMEVRLLLILYIQQCKTNLIQLSRGEKSRRGSIGTTFLI